MSAQGLVVLPFDYGAYGRPGSLILNGITDPSPNSNFGLVAGDILQLQLYPRDKTNGTTPTTSHPLSGGSTIVVTGKPAGQLNSTNVLFIASSFTTNTDGNGNAFYSGTLNLNTSDLISAIGSNNSLAVLLVIDITDASGNPQRFFTNITVYNEVYAGTESAPPAAAGAYVTSAQLAAVLSPAQGSFRVKTETDGTVNLQLWNATTNQWHTVYLTGAAGAIQLTIGAGES